MSDARGAGGVEGNLTAVSRGRSKKLTDMRPCRRKNGGMGSSAQHASSRAAVLPDDCRMGALQILSHDARR
eukprot:7286734-Pyramimonas_sp.AAC.1